MKYRLPRVGAKAQRITAVVLSHRMSSKMLGYYVRI